jgi:urea carboxylase-associated protein 2
VDGRLTDTSTTDAARAHARAQAARRAAYQPTVPASGASGVVDRAGQPVAPERMLWDDVVPPGGVTSRVLPRGTAVRLTDLDGDACANVLVYNAAQTAERLNVADTVKVQWQAYLGAGSLLLSDMGRVLMSVTADTSGTHDALCGASNSATNRARYGEVGVHGGCPDARDRFAVALAKHGLERRDIVPNVNFFQGVTVADDGTLVFTEAPPRPGASVELLAELPVVLVVANTPHVLDPRPDYTVTALRISAWTDAPTTRDDPAWAATPEGERAFLQSEEFVLTRDGGA